MSDRFPEQAADELSLPELSASCALAIAEIVELVSEGVLEVRGAGPEEWRFPGDTALRVHRVRRLQREFDVDAHAAGLLCDLLHELRALRHRLRRLEYQAGER